MHGVLCVWSAWCRMKIIRRGKLDRVDCGVHGVLHDVMLMINLIACCAVGGGQISR